MSDVFNVSYDAGDGTERLYLAQDVPSWAEAWHQLTKFNRLYVGKPYPNGKGVYPFHSPAIVRFST